MSAITDTCLPYPDVCHLSVIRLPYPDILMSAITDTWSRKGARETESLPRLVEPPVVTKGDIYCR